MAYDSSKFEHDSAFDPSEFIIPSNDSKGHSVAFHFRAPSSIQRASQQIVSSRKFPYVTTSDLIRHAISRHLDWLSEIAELLPGARSAVAMMHLENEFMRRKQEEGEYEEHFTLLQNQVQRLLAKPGGKREAQRLVSRAISVVRQVPDGFYRDQHLARLEEEFSHLIDGSKPKSKANGAGTGSEDEDGDGNGNHDKNKERHQ